MLATDPLSLVFLGCLLFAGVFLLVSLATGVGHGHILHAGHAVHAGQIHGAGHAGAAHAPAHATGGHAAAHAGLPATGAAPTPLATLWATTAGALTSSLNLMSALSFLFSFGLFGYLLHNVSRPGPFLTLFLPALFGAAAAMGVGLALTRLFAVSTGELTVEGTRTEGRVGTVSMAIEPNHVGEVIFARAGGGRQSIGARSSQGEEIAIGTEVVILRVVDGIATVESWESFMRNARSGTPTALAALDAPVHPADEAGM
ncbi:MAG TPA: NfeD family protein [Ktedonobacterales bacterium]|nr:NfeD family protein [Ktedonobacterales bacterium]